MTRYRYSGLPVLLAATAMLGACGGSGADGPTAPAQDEQAALEKAEAMIEDNRERLEANTDGENTANENSAPKGE